MKEGWKIRKLSQVFEVKSSKRVHQSDWRKEGIPFYRAREVVKLAKYGEVNNDLFISEELYSEFTENSGVPRVGDFIVSAVGTLGSCYLIKNDDQFYFKDASVLWFKKTANVNSRYLDYLFKSNQVMDQVMADSMGATVATLTIKRAKEILLPIPPLEEQKQIVKILDEAFEKIAKAKENTEKNLENAKELFESYLKQIFENPGDNWKNELLEKNCDFINGKAHEKLVVKNGKYIIINSKFISSDGLIFKTSNDCLMPLKKDDLVFVMSDVPNGKALAKFFLVDKDNLYTLNQRIGLIRNSTFDKNFLYYQLNRNKYFLSFNNGENQTNLRKKDILNCPLLVPPINEQKIIYLKIQELENKIDLLLSTYQKKSIFIDELKQSILQKAFNGELTEVSL